MNFIQLLATASTPSNSGLKDLGESTLDVVLEALKVVVPVALTIVVAFGLIYGIVLGVQFAKAEDADQRDKAKTRLINMVIGVLVAVVIIAIVLIVVNSDFIENWFDRISNKQNASGII